MFVAEEAYFPDLTLRYILCQVTWLGFVPPVK